MINGLDELLSDFDKLSGIEEPIAQLVQQQIEIVRANAAELAPTGVYAGGALRGSIHSEVEVEPDSVIGTAYTDLSYAMYVEFGTGQKGAADHDGVSPEVAVAYSLEPWWVHESQVDRAAAEAYGWFYIDTKDGRFYRISGQPAKPFLYPAIKNNEQMLAQNLEDGIAKILEEI